MKRETYAYVWKDHKFAGRKEISLDELKDYPCVSFNQSSEGNFYLTEEALSDHEYDKMIISDDRATTMEIIAELGGRVPLPNRKPKAVKSAKILGMWVIFTHHYP